MGWDRLYMQHAPWERKVSFPNVHVMLLVDHTDENPA